MMKKERFDKNIYVFSIILNFVFYLINISLFFILNRIKDIEKINGKYALAIVFFTLIELAVVAINSNTINPNGSVFHRIYYKKSIVSYVFYFVLIVMQFLTIKFKTKKLYYIYLSIWIVFLLISVCISKNILKEIDGKINDKEELKRLYNEYNFILEKIPIEIKIDIKYFFLKELAVYVFSLFFCDFIMNEIYVVCIYAFVYMILFWKLLERIFKHYYKNRYGVCLFFNTVFSGMGVFLVWYLHKYNCLNRELEELMMFQVIFLLPCMIWLSKKYGVYQKLVHEKIYNAYIEKIKKLR